jgi:hypothetical protein
LRRLLCTLLLCAGSGAWAQGLDVRLKGFGTVNDLPAGDMQREETGNPALDGNLDLRLMWTGQRGRWELRVDHTTIALAGDTYEFNQVSRGALDQTPTDDERRALELTWSLQKEDDYRLYHRFDRLALHYRAEGWGFTMGREAVSWGSGKAFNPLDLFAPFAPTTVDRDYKPGEDLLMFDTLLDSGGDLQALAVFRRDPDGNRELDEGSYGGKWRSFVGAAELELVLGSHYDETVTAVSLRFPLGGALVQTDWLATDVEAADEWKISGVVNIDYSFSLADKTAYVFGEYYRNGFGRNQSPVDLTELPVWLSERLQRGELFSLMKDYLALGGSYQWHALLMQSTTWLLNLHDKSSLLQTNLTYEPGDHQRLEAGFTVTAGGRGNEYGRIAVGDGFTSGGGSRLFVRWVYFW